MRVSVMAVAAIMRMGGCGCRAGFAGLDLRRIGDGRRRVPVGEVYLRRAEDAPETYRYVGASAKSRDGWESLGDLGFLDEGGYLYLTDRLNDMILVGGANVFPAEVEAALDEHPRVLSSCVIGLPDEELGSTVHAIVQVPAEVTDDELRAHLAERLAPYKIPHSFERTGQHLRDDAGKVRRSAWRAERLSAGRMKRIGWINIVLVVLVFAVMAPTYGWLQGLVLAGLVLVILVGYDRLAKRFLAARRERGKDTDRFR